MRKNHPPQLKVYRDFVFSTPCRKCDNVSRRSTLHPRKCDTRVFWLICYTLGQLPLDCCQGFHCSRSVVLAFALCVLSKHFTGAEPWHQRSLVAETRPPSCSPRCWYSSLIGLNSPLTPALSTLARASARSSRLVAPWRPLTMRCIHRNTSGAIGCLGRVLITLRCVVASRCTLKCVPLATA
jgi:hypothetical protein